MSVEQDEAAKPSAETRARSRFRRTVLLASAALVSGAALLALYLAVQHGLIPQFPTENASSKPVAASPRELTNEAASQLLAGALASRPIVARVPIGDVVTIDKSGQTLPPYPQLAEAQIVRLRFCHFPGSTAPANQICLADLTEKASQYVYSGRTPFKSVPVAENALEAKNRSFAQLILAVPRLTRVTQVVNQQPGQKQIGYTGLFEITPLAAPFGVSPDSLPSSIAGTATARATAAGWSIESDGLQ
jgi:hypothetical protein